MEIIKQIDDLTLEKWYFIYLDRHIYLNQYCILKRQSKEDKTYKIIKEYNKSYSKNSTITEKDVPLDDGIKNEAINQFINAIDVIKWG